jgi:hypothetical protein
MPCSGLRVWLLFAGIVAADLMRSIVIKGYLTCRPICANRAS